MSEEQQMPDGRWIPAQPLPFHEDTRPWYIRIWHLLKAFGMLFRGYDFDFIEDKIDEWVDPWYVPLKPPIERDLNKIRG